MRILDTDHLSQLHFDTVASQPLQGRLSDCDEMVLMTVISAEERLRSWLAEIQRHREGRRLVEAYARFQHSLEQLRDWTLLAWTDASDSIFRDLRVQRVRIGTQDLRIASVGLSLDAVVLSRNLRDFRQVPGLRVENWLD